MGDCRLGHIIYWSKGKVGEGIMVVVWSERGSGAGGEAAGAEGFVVCGLGERRVRCRRREV